MTRLLEKKFFHKQVYDLLKNDILSGKLSPGDKVNENMIAQEFGVSRSPVREAIRMLEQDELVVMGSVGAIVNPMGTKMLKELYECRIVMEPYAVRSALPYYTAKDIHSLKNIVKDSEMFFSKGQVDEVIRLNTEFHNCLVSVCKNERLKKTIQKYQELSFLTRQQEFYLYHKDQTFIQEHNSIIEAIRGKNPDEVEECVRTHLKNDMDFYCRQIENEN